MIARELISQTMPLLLCNDSGQKAINIMESYRVSHLPLVREKEYLGLISDSDIYDMEMEMCRLGENLNSFSRPYVLVNQHIYEVAQKMIDTKISVMPVLDMNENYLGLITINELSENLLKLVVANEPGAVIVLELNAIDYSLSQIAQIIESNDAKVLSLYTRNPENSNELDVTVKVNVSDITAIIQTFVRYDYNIKAVYMDDSLLKDMYTERYELFMKYMNL